MLGIVSKLSVREVLDEALAVSAKPMVMAFAGFISDGAIERHWCDS